MLKPDIYLQYKWAKLTETYLYPEKWWGEISRVKSWRGMLNLSGDISSIKQIEVGGMHAQVHHNLNLVHWTRANQVDVQISDDSYELCLPRISEPDSDFLIARISDGVCEYTMECLAEDKPSDKYIIDALDSQIDWVDSNPHLSFIAAGECTANWYIQSNGKWTKSLISNVTPGKHSFELNIPFGECVYLELKLISRDTPIIHRYYVVGKPGIASGRQVWYRGAMFESKMQKHAPWKSVIVPIFHPNDIDKIPTFNQWNQIDWWVFKNQTIHDSIEAINSRTGLNKVTIIGEYGDDDCDIQLLKPFQVHKQKLDPSKVYSICLFDDAGDIEYARRAGWSMFKINTEDLKNFNFIDRVWFQGLTIQSNSEGAKQYGYGFSFARPPENENLWTLSLRDIEWREHRESFSCHSCLYKQGCHQSLPMPYNPSDVKRVPWIAADRKMCPLLEVLSKN